jgi:hypothetical protein
MQADEEARVKKQREDLGDEKLKKLSSDLDTATDKNNMEAPSEIFGMILRFTKFVQKNSQFLMLPRFH